jgi:hypothetical protein
MGLLLAAGCDQEAGQTPVQPQPGEPGATPTPDSPAPPPTAGPAPTPADAPVYDAALDALLAEAQASCEIGIPGSSPAKCDELDKRIDAHLGEHGLATLDSLTRPLLGEDLKAKALAGWYLLANYPSGAVPAAAKEPDRVSEAAVLRLIQAVEKNPTPQLGAHSYAQIAAHLGTLKGLVPRVLQMVDALENEQVKSNAVQGLMRYGRLAVFDKLAELAAGPSRRVAAAALRAPLHMLNWTEAEKIALCPWYQDHLPAAEGELLEPVAQGLLRCGGPFVGKLLDEAEARARKKTYTRPLSFALREVCSKTLFSAGQGADEALCNRTKKVLQLVADQKGLDIKERAFAVDCIAYAWRDAWALKLMKTKYAKSKEKEIAAAGKKAIPFLEGYIKKAKPAPKGKKTR